MKTRWDAGQYKMNGKKHRHLSCGCCTISNYTNECLEREMAKEIREFKERQEPLGQEFQKVLDDNRWELYERD